MSESEEERRLRKEKKREAARRAAEKEAKESAAAAAAATDAKSTDTRTANETEEERRLRKEKKRALREAAKQQEEAEAAAAAASKSKEEERRARKERKEREAKAAAAGEKAGNAEDTSAAEQHHQHHHRQHTQEETASSAAAAPHVVKKKKKSVDENEELLSAIEAENTAVAAQTSARKKAATPVPADSANAAAEAARPETEEERAARKQAEREERRRQRHAAKAAAAAAEAAGGNGNGGGDAGNGGRSGAASSPAGPSPTTAFDPSELQRQAYRAQFQKDLVRATALRRLVDFDSSAGVVVDLAPQTAYDLYIRDFGQSGREQAGVQAPPEEERLDAGTQAERGKTRSRGAQAPADLGLCPEEEAERQFFQLRRTALQRLGKATDTAGSGAGPDGGEEEGDDANTNSNNNAADGSSSKGGAAKKSVRAVDAAVLERFLTSTLPLMSAVLDENNASAAGAAAAAANADASSNGSGKSKGTTAFSSSYTTFCWRGTRNRPLVQVMMNPANTRQLIALHGPRDESGPSALLDTYASVLLLWNVHNTTTPERVLVSFSSVTTVCVSPSRPHLIYGGTEDGNVCVWSLREPDRLHLAAGRFEKVVFHLPSYSTSWQADGHAAPVRQVRVSGYNAKTSSRKEEHELLVSMDEGGDVCYWVVTDKEGAGGKAANVVENDHGQHPFTSVSLHLSKNASSAAAAAGGEVETGADTSTRYGVGVSASFDFSPLDTAQYVLTAPHGVERRSRFGGIASPALYSPSQASAMIATPAAGVNGKSSTTTAVLMNTSNTSAGGREGVAVVPCCVQYSVLDPRWFVVGYEDGTLRLFLHNEATPKLTVEVGYQPIIAVRCSVSTPWVVWALDESGEVHMIDFAHHNRQTPRLSHPLTQPDTGVCTCMDVTGKDERADQRVLAAGFEKGMVQLHMLDTDKLRIANAERDEKWI